MSAAIQDALARLDALAAKWRREAAEITAANVARDDALPASCMARMTAVVETTDRLVGAVLDLAARSLSRELAAIRLAHSLPEPAASAVAPPAAVPPCAAGLTAGASKDAPAISGR